MWFRKPGPFRKEVTRDLWSLNLLTKMMVLHCQILFHLANAEAILMQTSAEQVPSLHRVAPRYLKLVTSSNFIPFVLISALMLVMLLVLILLFSVLTFIPYAVALFTSLLVRFWKFTIAADHKIHAVGKS